MKKFKFKLAQVLRYRLLLEDIAKSTYQASLTELQNRINKLKELEHEKITVRKGLVIKKGAKISAQIFEFISIYLKQLNFLIDIQADLINQQKIITKEKLEDWTMRRKDSKIIKNLEEKQKREYIEASEKEEQRFLDDIFLARMNGEVKDEK
jgi:flagellar export protein FliJ